MTEFWMLTWPIAGRTAQVAQLAEATGWDGLLITDTQCLAADSFSSRCASPRRSASGSGPA